MPRGGVRGTDARVEKPLSTSDSSWPRLHSTHSSLITTAHMCPCASKGLVTGSLGSLETYNFYQNYSDLLCYRRTLFFIGEKLFMDTEVVNFI